METLENCDVIYSYTRKQALEDGVLVDLTKWGKASEKFPSGFTCSVAFTNTLWVAVQNLPNLNIGLRQIKDRSIDVIYQGAKALREAMTHHEDEAVFDVVLPQKGKAEVKEQLLIQFHEGDEGEPAVTIGFPIDF